MEHLKTFESAAEILEKNGQAIPSVEGIDPKHAKAIVAIYKLFVISEAAWKFEGKSIDWNNYDQRKHYHWFDLESASGSACGFSFGGCVCGLSFSCVGSRLVFPSREVAEYVAKTHLELYKDFMTL